MARKNRERAREARKLSRPTLIAIMVVSAISIALSVGAIGIWLGTLFFWSADGTVVRSGIQEKQLSKTVQYSPRIEYTYRVRGALYRGKRYSFEFIVPGNKEWATSVRNAYPAGAKCRVWYFPLRPSISVLRRRPRGSEIFCWTSLGLVSASILHGARITLRRKRDVRAL
jgi:hypothetical protein